VEHYYDVLLKHGGPYYPEVLQKFTEVLMK